MKVVLLAAGFATRLYPLTLDRAKPLLEVRDRPILSWILDRALALPDITDVVVIANHRFAAQFEQWRQEWSIHVPIRVIDDGATSDATRLGAVRDLLLALERSPPAEDVLVCAGDNLIDFSLAPFHAEYRAAGRVPMVMYRRVAGTVPPARHGEIVADEAGRVIAFREKPPQPTSPLVSVGIYLFPAAIVGWLQAYLAQGGNPDAPGHLLEWLVGVTQVQARPIGGDWFDIGNHETLDAARRTFRANDGLADVRQPPSA